MTREAAADLIPQSHLRIFIISTGRIKSIRFRWTDVSDLEGEEDVGDSPSLYVSELRFV